MEILKPVHPELRDLHSKVSHILLHTALLLTQARLPCSLFHSLLRINFGLNFFHFSFNGDQFFLVLRFASERHVFLCLALLAGFLRALLLGFGGLSLQVLPARGRLVILILILPGGVRGSRQWSDGVGGAGGALSWRVNSAMLLRFGSKERNISRRERACIGLGYFSSFSIFNSPFSSRDLKASFER